MEDAVTFEEMVRSEIENWIRRAMVDGVGPVPELETVREIAEDIADEEGFEYDPDLVKSIWVETLRKYTTEDVLDAISDVAITASSYPEFGRFVAYLLGHMPGGEDFEDVFPTFEERGLYLGWSEVQQLDALLKAIRNQTDVFVAMCLLLEDWYGE